MQEGEMGAGVTQSWVLVFYVGPFWLMVYSKPVLSASVIQL